MKYMVIAGKHVYLVALKAVESYLTTFKLLTGQLTNKITSKLTSSHGDMLKK